MAKPLTTTTTTHACAITIYVALILLSAQHLVNFARHVALSALIGPAVPLWGALFFSGSLLALAAALISPRMRVPVKPLWVEFCGASVLTLVVGVYAFSLTWYYGWSSSPDTQTYAWTIAVGCFARAIQIFMEQRRIKRALAMSVPADPVPLAEGDSLTSG